MLRKEWVSSAYITALEQPWRPLEVDGPQPTMLTTRKCSSWPNNAQCWLYIHVKRVRVTYLLGACNKQSFFASATTTTTTRYLYERRAMLPKTNHCARTLMVGWAVQKWVLIDSYFSLLSLVFVYKRASFERLCVRIVWVGVAAALAKSGGNKRGGLVEPVPLVVSVCVCVCVDDDNIL